MNDSRDDGLNSKQRKFCEEYVKDNNGAQAAIRAGYAEKAARVTASKLLTKPNIKAYIAKLKAELVEECQIEAHMVLNLLKMEAMDPKNPSGTRVQALGLLGKYLSLFTDRVEHSGDPESPRVIKRIAVYKNEAGELVEEDLETGEETKLSPQ
jgi:phage terminase small subunit